MKTILLADDDKFFLQVLTRFLGNTGYQVVACRNGQEALERLLAAESSGDPFDLVLMDMNMPVMDGYESTRQIRASGYQGPIIALTASAMAEDREECLRVGCSDFLAKPIDRGRLLGVLARHLAKPSR